MPIETNLPTMVHLYLELINKIESLSQGVDTSTPVHKVYESEIEHYFFKIREELEKAKKAEDMFTNQP
jgi:hypothetical protein